MARVYRKQILDAKAIAEYRNRFDARYTIDPVSGCWIWNRGMNGKGYGYMWMNGVTRQAYKIAYEFYIGPVPEGKELDHICRNR